MDAVARYPPQSINVSPATVLFMCVFTSQAAVLVLAPILVSIAHDLHVSTAVAGQLRIFGVPVAIVVALALARYGGRVRLRRLLLGSSASIATGSVVSALAPSFIVLALAQVPLWIGVAGLVAAGIGAAGAWSEPEMRSRVVARALAGAPAAWVIGMPTIGAVADVSWRLAFVAVPLPAAAVTAALLIVSGEEGSHEQRNTSLALLLRQPRARSWALGELLAMSAWAGTLVFSGALFIETYGTSTETTGLLLALIAIAYLGGNAVGGRIRERCSLRRTLLYTNLGAALAIAAVWTLTPHVVATLLLFALASAVVGARTVVGTSYGFVVAGEQKLEVGAARALFTHIGYLMGSLLGGAGYLVGGRPVVGFGFAALLLIAALPYASMWSARCPREQTAFA
jgi:MFS transporter, DHA1 family, inner membrane transport protein